MKGFKNSTKAQSGHCFPGEPGYAQGGIVVPLGGGMGRGAFSAPRPVIPRPRVMPNPKMQTMHVSKLAKGGPVGVRSGGGPYNPPGGNTLEKDNRPYSQEEKEHPRTDARPGYAKGGRKIKKGALHKDMGIPQGQKIPVGAIRAKLSRDKASGNKKGVKRDVFAINAKTKFADGGPVRGTLAFMNTPMFGK